MDEAAKSALQDHLLDMIRTIAPTATFRPMYGGTVIEMEAANPKTRVGGIFVYEAHVSLEFTHGAEFADPDGVLAGAGKKRRHIKLHRLSDVDAKNCAGFVRQATA